jgi:hypothetical protein
MMRRTTRRPSDPTPAQIRAACRQIQRTWDATIRERRQVVPHQPAQTAVVSVRGLGDGAPSRAE